MIASGSHLHERSHSQGKTKKEALENIKEAIEGWLEVMEEKHPFNRRGSVGVGNGGKIAIVMTPSR